MCWWVPVIHARPATVGMIAGRSATTVSAAMVQWNSDPISEIPVKRSPTFSRPRACSTDKGHEFSLAACRRSKILDGLTSVVGFGARARRIDRALLLARQGQVA